ncbi:MAG: histidine phosphatase family protein [Gammaproteobacteria bacterium]|nr:histidine phosphatase family protein [Gammaproteobacteria bacterium]
MPLIYMIRHGKAAAGFASHANPGLDEQGVRQAEATAEALASVGPLPVYSSPLARAVETAMPLARRWQVEPVIEPRVAEIPSPTEDLAERGAWLRQIMQGRWQYLDQSLQAWRRDLVEFLAGLEQDAVVFCHFIAINVAVGAARNDDRLVVFPPDYGSVTLLSNDHGALELLELGRSAQTQVN